MTRTVPTLVDGEAVAVRRMSGVRLALRLSLLHTSTLSTAIGSHYEIRRSQI
jgi:hypothetical protein